jgi:hypothetical protein
VVATRAPAERRSTEDAASRQTPHLALVQTSSPRS